MIMFQISQKKIKKERIMNVWMKILYVCLLNEEEECFLLRSSLRRCNHFITTRKNKNKYYISTTENKKNRWVIHKNNDWQVKLS